MKRSYRPTTAVFYLYSYLVFGVLRAADFSPRVPRMPPRRLGAMELGAAAGSRAKGFFRAIHGGEADTILFQFVIPAKAGVQNE